MDNENPAQVNTPGEDQGLTFGGKAVGLTFNPGNNEDVDRAKKTIANAIDQMNQLRSVDLQSTETKRLASIAITELQAAQMWMVKAITWKD